VIVSEVDVVRPEDFRPSGIGFGRRRPTQAALDEMADEVDAIVDAIVAHDRAAADDDDGGKGGAIVDLSDPYFRYVIGDHLSAAWSSVHSLGSSDRIKRQVEEVQERLGNVVAEAEQRTTRV
jgi:hypothetical protein